jgi:arylformamidase
MRGAVAPRTFAVPSRQVAMPRFHDISLTVSESIITYPGDPEIRFTPHARIADGDDANVTRIAFGTHTGTHLDAPRHFIDGGRTVDQLALETLIGPAVVARIPGDVRAIGAEELRAAGIEGAERVLLRTRNSALLAEDEFREDFAYFTAEGAEYLVQIGVRLVALDYLSIEAFDADGAPAHQALLGAGVVVVEGVDLREVPPGEYELICLPLRLAGLDGSPVRAVLREDG